MLRTRMAMSSGLTPEVTRSVMRPTTNSSAASVYPSEGWRVTETVPLTALPSGNSCLVPAYALRSDAISPADDVSARLDIMVSAAALKNSLLKRMTLTAERRLTLRGMVRVVSGLKRLSILLSRRQSPERQRYMLCFTSPTMRLLNPWDRESSSRMRKLSHWVDDVSWNSSIMMFLMRTPTFSYMKGASDVLIMRLRSICVSESRKRFCSLLLLSIFSFMAPNIRRRERYLSVSRAVAAMILFSRIVCTASMSMGRSLLAQSCRNGAGDVFFTQLSASVSSGSVALARVFDDKSISRIFIVTIFCMRPYIPRVPPLRSEDRMLFSSMTCHIPPVRFLYILSASLMILRRVSMKAS